MNDTIVLPTYSDEALAELSPAKLTDLLIENEDRVPRNVIDECVRRDEGMTEYLGMLHDDDFLWDPTQNDGVWWLRLHAAMILGFIPSEQAGRLLVELMRRMSLEEDDNLQDWLSGYWPALFKNKPDCVLHDLRALCEDRDMDWYMRANAVEPVMSAAQRQGGEPFELALAWLAKIVADETEDWDFRLPAANTLLDYRRPEYRSLLEDMADRQSGLEAFFDHNDVQRAYDKVEQEPDRRADPWQFYEPDAITRRQIRWRDEDEQDDDIFDLEDDDDYLDDPYLPYFPPNSYVPETYVRPEPKVGRNDPCPCGSGKKYKKCCLA